MGGLWVAQTEGEWHLDVARRMADEARERRDEEKAQKQIEKFGFVPPSGYAFFLRIITEAEARRYLADTAKRNAEDTLMRPYGGLTAY